MAWYFISWIYPEMELGPTVYLSLQEELTMRARTSRVDVLPDLQIEIGAHLLGMFNR